MSDGTKIRNRSSCWTTEELGEINGMITKAVIEVSEGKPTVICLTEGQFEVLKEAVVDAVTYAVRMHLATQPVLKQRKN
jgi:hypothetical protein